MSRTAKIAGVAALAGMMMAVVVAGVVTRERPAPATTPIPQATAAPEALTRELERCATLTMPDAGCEAAWATNRRRFFGEEGAQP
ncbi:putative entry exclusion protein TrbK-alt [Bosea sp. (in: a-proteobacteria)]|uniref:putative entry exclusion protein TrbK-alt n=1 Tax=Bosea sp. (in: a-proteobacteria) TaxID=1871050 RepID=UPI0025C286C6|nr:putative entry exclusion protein TrbK-alt [Bosea sp. (in: a-proteobacteria)]MBR3192739.1 putative entry exclusion protein TrbK-alt [Bosea sp. (in: a-proteobacteria)]